MHVRVESRLGEIVHKPPEEMLEIQRLYGLRIFSFSEEALSKAKNEIRPRRFEFYGISQLLEGRGFFWTENGGRQSYEPGQAVFTVPGMRHDYGGDASNYLEDSLCFSGPVADMLLAAGVIQPGIFAMGPLRRLKPIFEFVPQPSREAQVKANILLQSLLVEIHLDRTMRQTKGKGAIQRLLQAIAANSERHWTVKEMADSCHLGESQLRRLFIVETGLHPKAYLDKLRMRHAASLLMSSDMSIKDIAAKGGYPDPYHFSRRFKQLMKLSPETYRERHSLRNGICDLKDFESETLESRRIAQMRKSS